MFKKFIGILGVIALTATMNMNAAAAPSMQKQVLNSNDKVEKNRVFTSIEQARKAKSYFGDPWGVAWNGTLERDEYFEVEVYQLDDNQQNPQYKFKYKAPWAYTYYQDIVMWYPSLAGKNVKLSVSKAGKHIIDAYGVVNSNKVDAASLQERAGGDYLEYDADYIKVEYNGKIYYIYSNGEVVKSRN